MSDFQTKIFFEIHSGSLREGPGSFESTQKAFSSLRDLPEAAKILDVGCGPGQQSLDLAKLSNGNITAVDNYQPFLDNLLISAKNLRVDHKVDVLNKDMFNLDFNPNSFDLIWSEGAIYIIGLEKGLNEWRPFLKQSGFLAVSHISWLKDNPPEELFNFWNSEYPSITNVEKNLEIIEKCGYTIINHFTLPKSDWLENYYKPIENKLTSLKLKYRDNPEAMEVIDMEITEIDLYKKFSDYYGYEFFITKKIKSDGC